MKSREVHPPWVASWLVDLFTPIGQTETIQGDLLEEFSEVASKSGVASARRWYWRQSVKSVAHLIGTGFRAAPWTAATGSLRFAASSIAIKLQHLHDYLKVAAKTSYWPTSASCPHLTRVGHARVREAAPRAALIVFGCPA